MKPGGSLSGPTRNCKTPISPEKLQDSHIAEGYHTYPGLLRIGFNGLVGFPSLLLSFVLFFGFFVSLLSFLAIGCAWRVYWSRL